MAQNMSLDTIVLVLVKRLVGISSSKDNYPVVPLEASFTSMKKKTESTGNENVRENSSNRKGYGSGELQQNTYVLPTRGEVRTHLNFRKFRKLLLDKTVQKLAGYFFQKQLKDTYKNTTVPE